MLGAEALDRIRLQLKVPIRCAAVGVEPSEVALEGLIELPARLIAPQARCAAAQLGKACAPSESLGLGLEGSAPPPTWQRLAA